MLPLHQSPSGGHCRRHQRAWGRRTFIGRLRASIRGMPRLLLIAVVLAALFAGEARAAVVPFGPDLAPLAANADPRASCASGTPTPIPMGVGGSCMWSFMGIGAGAASLVPPAPGTVTAVRVKVGPVTGRMRVNVIRFLFRQTGDNAHPFDGRSVPGGVRPGVHAGAERDHDGGGEPADAGGLDARAQRPEHDPGDRRAGARGRDADDADSALQRARRAELLQLPRTDGGGRAGAEPERDRVAHERVRRADERGPHDGRRTRDGPAADTRGTGRAPAPRRRRRPPRVSAAPPSTCAATRCRFRSSARSSTARER